MNSSVCVAGCTYFIQHLLTFCKPGSSTTSVPARWQYFRYVPWMCEQIKQQIEQYCIILQIHTRVPANSLRYVYRHPAPLFVTHANIVPGQAVSRRRRHVHYTHTQDEVQTVTCQGMRIEQCIMARHQIDVRLLTVQQKDLEQQRACTTVAPPPHLSCDRHRRACRAWPWRIVLLHSPAWLRV